MLSEGVPPLALDGVRVLDLSDALGAYCSRLLADLGAEVLKVEPPEGDRMRRRPPFPDGAGESAMSPVFAAYHSNKRGVTLDVASDQAIPLLGELGEDADVVVVTPSRRSPVVGLDAEAGGLSWARADAVVAALTPFGLTGPLAGYRATPLTSHAMSGLMHRCGTAETPPLGIPGQILWDEAGIHAAVAVLAALSSRSRVGGQLLDLAVHEVAPAHDFLLERYDAEALGNWGRAILVGIPPSGTWECADGPFDVAAHQRRHWDAFLTMLDHPDALSEPSLEDPLLRRQLFDGIIEAVQPLIGDKQRLELFEKGQQAGLPCCPVNTPADFVADSQPQARGLLVDQEVPGLGSVTLPWRSFHSSPEMQRLRRPAPTLGQHNREVFVEELGHTDGELDTWREEGLV